jgi:PD-(D/E)XK nuclease superfamily/Exodeoxyribonuclease V, gamma subunit
VYFLSVVQYGIVSLLMRLAPNGGVVVNFTDSANVDATRFIDFTWQRFVNDESLAESAFPEFVPSSEKPGALGQLRARIFSLPGKEGSPLVPDDTFQILAAPDAYREVEEVCLRIRKLLESDVPAHQIGVVCKNSQNYTPPLLELAKHYGIPLDFSRNVPLPHMPIIVTILGLLDLAGSNFSREEFLRVLNSVYLRPEAWISEDIVGLVNESGYLDEQHGGLEDLLLRMASRDSESPPQKILDLAARVKSIKDQLHFLASFIGSFSEFAALTRHLLIDLGFFQKMTTLTGAPLFVVHRDREALQTFLSVLDEAGLLLNSLAEGPMPFRAFLKQATEIMGAVTLPVRSSSHSAVPVLSPVQVLGLKIDFVFLLGLSEGEFPRLIWESALLKDLDRRQLNPLMASALSRKFGTILERSTLRKALLTSVEKSRQEPLHFFLVLECAGKQLTCSYPLRDLEGKTVLPSVYVGETLRHFKASTADNSVVYKLPTTAYGQGPSEIYDWHSLLRVVAKGWVPASGVLQHTEQDPRVLMDLFHSLGLDLAHLRRLALLERGRKTYFMGFSQVDPQFKSHYADLSDMSSLYGGVNLQNRKWSPAEFEALSACPFAYFGKYVLNLKPRDSPDYDIKPSELVPLIRRVLDQFHSTALSGSASREQQRMRSLLKKAFQAWERNVPKGNLGYWEIRRDEVRDALEGYAKYAALSPGEDFQNLPLELAPGTVLPVAGLDLPIEGRLPRIMVHEEDGKVESIQVVDFRYSDDRTRFGRLTRQESFGKTSFQLPLVLYLIWRQLAEQGKEMTPGLRFFGRFVLLRNSLQKECQFEAGVEMFGPSLQSGVLPGVESLLRRVQRGVFHPEPLASTCETCKYDSLCRYWTCGAGKALRAQRGPKRDEG